MNAMIDYANGKTFCRGSFFSHYFGDHRAKPCGVCDNCLEAKRNSSETDLAPYIAHIDNKIQLTPITVQELLSGATISEQLNYWKAIEYLVSEQLIITDVYGYLKKRGPNQNKAPR